MPGYYRNMKVRSSVIVLFSQMYVVTASDSQQYLSKHFWTDRVTWAVWSASVHVRGIQSSCGMCPAMIKTQCHLSTKENIH